MSKLFDEQHMGEGLDGTSFLTSLLQSATEYAVVATDLTGVIVLWSEGAHRLYGFLASEALGKTVSRLLDAPADVEPGQSREIMEIALRDGKWEGITQRLRNTKKPVTVRVVVTPLRKGAMAASGFVMISKDVSAEARVNEELRGNQFYTRSLIESSLDALMTTDPIGIISDVNKQMVALTGRSREELIGSPFKNYFTEPDVAEKGIKYALTNGRVTNYELTALSKDGRTTLVSYNATTFRDAENKLQGVFAGCRHGIYFPT